MCKTPNSSCRNEGAMDTGVVATSLNQICKVWISIKVDVANLFDSLNCQCLRHKVMVNRGEGEGGKGV
jgi:hypothetical protein